VLSFQRPVVWRPEARLPPLPFSSAVSYSIPRIVYDLFGILFQRRDDRRREAPPRVAGVSHILCTSSLDSTYFVDVQATRVVTLGVGLSASCRIPSQGSSSLHSELCVGVGTNGVGLQVSCRMGSRGSSLLYLKYLWAVLGWFVFGLVRLC
jgi:hypothetical protein